MEKSSNLKKIMNIVKTVLVWIVVAIAVGMMIFTLFSVFTFDQNDRNLFGYKFFVATSDSMSATDFDAGDIVISREVEDIRALKAGDIITFVSQSSHNYGETVTHKIREVVNEPNGGISFVTYGTTTDTNDEALASIIVGQYVGRIPKLGSFFLFLKTTPGYLLCIFLPFLILIIAQGLNCVRLFRQYKKEQMSEMQAERERLAQEREENQRVMAELLELKAQLTQSGAASATPPAPAEPAAPVEQPAPAEPTTPAEPEAPQAPESDTSFDVQR